MSTVQITKARIMKEIINGASNFKSKPLIYIALVISLMHQADHNFISIHSTQVDR